MLLNIFNYLIFFGMIAWNDVSSKIHRNQLDSNDSYTFERRSNQLQKHEYVPLNSITLNLLYNKNKPQHVLDSNKRNHWSKLKKKKKGVQKNSNVEKNKTLHEKQFTNTLNNLNQATKLELRGTTEVIFVCFYSRFLKINYNIVKIISYKPACEFSYIFYTF